MSAIDNFKANQTDAAAIELLRLVLSLRRYEYFIEFASASKVWVVTVVEYSGTGEVVHVSKAEKETLWLATREAVGTAMYGALMDSGVDPFVETAAST